MIKVCLNSIYMYIILEGKLININSLKSISNNSKNEIELLVTKFLNLLKKVACS